MARHGAPTRPEQLAHHACLVVASDGAPMRWPFRAKDGLRLLPVSGRLTTTAFSTAHAAALAGLGIGLFPEFACADDLRQRRLLALFGAQPIEVGSIWLLHAARRFLPALQVLIDLVRERFKPRPPWL